MIEHFAIASALLQNRIPAESGLCALQNQKFEEHTIVVNRDAPFLVVVRNI